MFEISHKFQSVYTTHVNLPVKADLHIHMRAVCLEPKSCFRKVTRSSRDNCGTSQAKKVEVD